MNECTQYQCVVISPVRLHETPSVLSSDHDGAHDRGDGGGGGRWMYRATEQSTSAADLAIENLPCTNTGNTGQVECTCCTCTQHMVARSSWLSGFAEYVQRWMFANAIWVCAFCTVCNYDHILTICLHACVFRELLPYLHTYMWFIALILELLYHMHDVRLRTTGE